MGWCLRMSGRKLRIIALATALLITACGAQPAHVTLNPTPKPAVTAEPISAAKPLFVEFYATW